jgi:adenylate kinase family enzyme
MHETGKKIVVVGISASGKSTLSRQLAESVNLPLTHMDTIWWKPGWVEVSDEDATKQLDALTQTSEWIVEGYIPHGARDFVFGRASSILYLDYSGITAAWRYIKRWLKHRKKPRPELQGSPDSFHWYFLKRVWTKQEAISLEKDLTKVQDQDKILRFKNPKETASFLRHSVN